MCSIARENSSLDPEHMILPESNIVQQSLQVFSIKVPVLVQQFAAITLHLESVGRQRGRKRDRDTLQRADIRLAANRHRSIFDHDVGPDQRVGGGHICFQSQTKYCSIFWIDGNLSVISGKTTKDFFSTFPDYTAERNFVVRFLPRHRKLKDRNWPSLALFPMAPCQIALSCIYKYCSQNRPEYPRCRQSVRCRFLVLLYSRIHLLAPITIKHGVTGPADGMQALVGD